VEDLLSSLAQKELKIMKLALAVACVCIIALASCSSIGYQSTAPEDRGERAISSDIELVKEVDLGGSTLGVFYSHEVYESGDEQLLLFTRRSAGPFNGTGTGTMNDYQLSIKTASLTVDQAKKFLSTIDNYLAMDPKSITPTKMFNFELYSGILGDFLYEKHRHFSDLTFIVLCSVTNTTKSFKTVFPQTSTDLAGRGSTSYATFDLNLKQVQNLREAISAALDKSTPTPTVAPAEKSGT
jgi:hypothetical protein